VLTATSLSYGKAKNSTSHRIRTPDLIEIKFGTVDYVGEVTPHAKFRVNLHKGASRQIGEIYARLVVDVDNRQVWSRRPESATNGQIGPNPEFPVPNNSVHSSVAMTEPKHARRVVVWRAMASIPEALDIKASPTCMRPSGNSSSSSQAMTQAPSAHSGRRIPALRDHTTQRALAEQPIWLLVTRTRINIYL